jgi:CheY-like chemotaxis protein
VGISPEILPKIFDPFFTTKSKGKGTGLGLAMVYGIIDSHNGFIEVSTHINNGSDFTVLLPVLIQEKPLVDVAADSEILQLGTGTILIIDDEEAIRKTVGKMLESMGYNTITADNGENGVKIYRQQHAAITAVILDMAMPGISGLETYKILAAVNPKVKVLVASGYTNDVRVAKTIELGAQGFIQKPFSMNALSVKIAAVINSH